LVRKNPYMIMFRGFTTNRFKRLRRTIQRAARWPAGPLSVGGATPGGGFREPRGVAKKSFLVYKGTGKAAFPNE
jgi:hypothetical protein